MQLQRFSPDPIRFRKKIEKKSVFLNLFSYLCVFINRNVKQKQNIIMKKAILSIFMLLGAIYSNAQNGFSLPLQENLFHNIPDTGTSIIEGNVTNVPDGTIVNFWFYKDGDYLGEPADTIIGGKFRFERKIDKWARYFITVADAKDELAIRPEPGNTIRITGNSPYCAFWKAETYDPWLAEKNEYIAYRKEHISDYMNLKEENGELTAKVNRYFLDKASKEEKRKLQNQIDSICEKEISMYEEYVNAMYEFMKDMPYSDIYLKEFRDIARIASYENDGNQQHR